MIIKLEELAEFIPVDEQFVHSLKRIKTFLKHAHRFDLLSVIGFEQAAVFKSYTGNDQIILQAIELAKSVEANLGMYYYLPSASMQVTPSGVIEVSPDNYNKTSQKDVRDVLRFYKKAGLKFLDSLLELMELNEDSFLKWKASKQYTKFQRLLVNATGEFQEHYNIFNSRQTFLSLVSEIEISESQFLVPVLTEPIMTQLKTARQTQREFIEAKRLASKASVLFVVSKTLGSGLYFQESSGFQMRFDLLDYERNFSSKEILDEYTKKQRREKENEAMNFLKQALKIIEKSPEVFPNYIPKQVSNDFRFIKGKSIIAI